MTIPSGVLRVSLIWTPSSDWPSESAVNTFHMVQQTGTGGGTIDPQYVADQLATKLLAGWSGVAANHPTSFAITGLKTYRLDTSGHTEAEGSHTFSPSDLEGTSPGHLMPPECAICLSLYSYTPGGFTSNKGRKRGRMYLPYLTATVNDIDGKVTSAAQTSLTTGWAALFNAFNTIESASGRTDPMGVVVLSKVSPGATYEVIWVAVDSHWDAQRRRQRQDVPVVVKQPVTAW